MLSDHDRNLIHSGQVPEVVEYKYAYMVQEDNTTHENNNVNTVDTSGQGSMYGLPVESYPDGSTKLDMGGTERLTGYEAIEEIPKSLEKNNKHGRLKKLRSKVSKAAASGTLDKISEEKEYRFLHSDANMRAECRIVELKNGEKHLLIDLYERVPTKPPEFNRTPSNVVICSRCNSKVGNTVEEQSDHIEKSHNNPFSFKCLLCDHGEYEITSECTMTSIHQHIRRNHLKDDQYYQCEKCKSTFWIKVKYERHMKKCTGHYDDSGVCNQCGKYVKTMSNHVKTHQARSYHCLKCPLVFKTRSRLTIHTKIVHAEDPEKMQTICGECGKICKNLYALGAHRRSVHPKTLQKCTYEGCNKEFKTKDALKNHAFIHSNQKPMSCNYCEFSCRQRNSMDVHMNTHHKDKSYDRPTPNKYGVKVKGQYLHLQQ